MNIVKRKDVLSPSEILKKLKPCNWKYKPDNETNIIGLCDDKIHYGFIAQDLLETFGDDYAFVIKDSTCEDSYLKVNYIQFIGIITSVVKDQEKRIQKLENQIKGK